MNRIERIRASLEAALRPTLLQIEDDSAQHVGHAGAASGGGHYRVRIVAEAFAGKPALARHRMVYDGLGQLMGTAVHAISINAQTPEEALRGS
jgi:BolA protein